MASSAPKVGDAFFSGEQDFSGEDSRKLFQRTISVARFPFAPPQKKLFIRRRMNAALPTFSAEAIVRDRIALLDTSASFLAALAGIPQSRLSLALNGTRSLGAEDGERLKALTIKLIELRDACGIFPL